VAVGSQWYGHAPVWVGIENGVFEQNGFRVEWKPVAKSMDRLIAVTSGSARFASLGEIAMLKAMSRGKRGFYWVGNQDIAPGFEGLVARKGIDTFEGLRGKRIGFPFSSSVDLTARILLQQNGLDPDKDVKLVNLEVGDVPSAFATGAVDAALIWEPGFTELRNTPGATVLGMDTDTEIYKRFGTMTGPDVLILSQTWADADPERARRFLRVYFECVAWVEANPDETARIILEGGYIEQKAEILRRDLKKFVWHDLEDQAKVMTDAGIFGQAQYVIDNFLEEIGCDTSTGAFDFKEWVRMDLLRKE
jgi:ABC-type nitrate/sulfonate/bicarbonate transport system substrate-binding protein